MLYVCKKEFFIPTSKLKNCLSQSWRTLLSLFLYALLTACGGPPQFIDEGQESPAILSLLPTSSVDFGDTLTGFSYTRTFIIINQSSTVPATNMLTLTSLNSPFSYSGGNYPGTNGDCGTTLDAEAQCTIEIDINPTIAGSAASLWNLEYNDGLATQTLDLTLTTNVRDPLPAILAFTPSGNHDYGVVAIGGFNDTSITVTNNGDLPATSLAISGLTNPFSVLSSTCGATLAAQAQCSLTIRFSPASQATFNNVLSLSYHDSTATQSINKNLQGEGRVAGFIVIDEGNNFDFLILNSGFTEDQTLTIRNTGGGNASSLNIGSINPPLSVVGNSCPATLAPAAACSVVVRFSPTSTTALSETLDVDFFDGFSNQNIQADFNGQGFANSLQLSLITPATAVSNVDTPTIEVSQLISGLGVRLYSNSGCTVQVGTLSATGSSLNFSPTMTEGSYQFHSRAEDSHGNLTPCSTAFAAYEYDNTTPNPSASITIASSFTTSSSSPPTFSWTASSSPDVADYQLGISTSALGGNSDGGWQSVGNTTSATMSGQTLIECQDYYASVQVIDGVGLTSNHTESTGTFRYDSAIPTAPGSLAESGDASDTNSATVTWVASIDTCGIDYYEVAISEDVNTNGALDSGEIGNVVNFTNVGNILTHRYNGLSLTSGVNHYTSVRAVDNTGRTSVASVSQPWIIYNPSIELPDMIVWLDANDPATILDAQGDDASSGAFDGTVDRWLDKSGSTNTHNFTDSGTLPTYNGTNFSLIFDGATTGMTTGNHAEINTALVNQRNITVAFETSADINSRQILYEEGGSIRGMNIYIFNGELYCGFYNTPAGDGDGVQPFTSVNTSLNINTTYFVTWVFDYTNYTSPSGPDGSLTCYLDGSAFGAVPTTSRLFGHSGAVGLGHVNGQTCFEDTSCPNTGSHFFGEIYEVMLFNNAPDAADITNVHTYLDNKWK